MREKIIELTKEQLPTITLIFEKALGNELCDSDERKIVGVGLSDYPAEELAKSIIYKLNSENENSEFRSTAYWVLSKRFDKNLLPLFKKWLKIEINAVNSHAVYQLLIALDNLKEPVFGNDRNGRYSFDETDLNLRDAQNYLQSHA